jgi:hypothetical protein
MGNNACILIFIITVQAYDSNIRVDLNTISHCSTVFSQTKVPREAQELRITQPLILNLKAIKTNV